MKSQDGKDIPQLFSPILNFISSMKSPATSVALITMMVWFPLKIFIGISRGFHEVPTHLCKSLSFFVSQTKWYKGHMTSYDKKKTWNLFFKVDHRAKPRNVKLNLWKVRFPNLALFCNFEDDRQTCNSRSTFSCLADYRHGANSGHSSDLSVSNVWWQFLLTSLNRPVLDK